MDEEDTHYGLPRSLAESVSINGRVFSSDTNIDIPKIFLWKEDLPSKSNIDAMLLNRHNEGISKEDLSMLRTSEDTASAAGVCKLPGLKVIFDRKDISEEQKATLEPLDISHNESMDFLQELYEKSKLAMSEEDNIAFHFSITNETDWLQMANFHAEWTKKFCDVMVPYIHRSSIAI